MPDEYRNPRGCGDLPAFCLHFCIAGSLLQPPVYPSLIEDSGGNFSSVVGSPVLMVLSCHPDTHYSYIRVRPVSRSLDRDPHKSTTIQLPYTCYKTAGPGSTDLAFHRATPHRNIRIRHLGACKYFLIERVRSIIMSYSIRCAFRNNLFIET